MTLIRFIFNKLAILTAIFGIVANTNAVAQDTTRNSFDDIVNVNAFSDITTSDYYGIYDNSCSVALYNVCDNTPNKSIGNPYIIHQAISCKDFIHVAYMVLGSELMVRENSKLNIIRNNEFSYNTSSNLNTIVGLQDTDVEATDYQFDNLTHVLFQVDISVANYNGSVSKLYNCLTNNFAKGVGNKKDTNTTSNTLRCFLTDM